MLARPVDGIVEFPANDKRRSTSYAYLDIRLRDVKFSLARASAQDKIERMPLVISQRFVNHMAVAKAALQPIRRRLNGL